MEASKRELYNNLMKLCGEPDSPFFYTDFDYDEYTYRIFNYRLASYSDFLKPDALWCRGVMFNIHEGELDDIVCRPPKKFFNLEENPFTQNLNHSKIKSFMDKEDGSLISTYIHYRGETEKLAFKSKGSIRSDQVMMAKKWIMTEEHRDFAYDLFDATLCGWTVNMELVSPDNQVVVRYPATQLRILNMVDNETGEVIYKEDREEADVIFDDRYWVNTHYIQPGTYHKFVESIPKMTGIEGFVLRYQDGTLAKQKTEWYMQLHHNKDSVTIPRRLFECVIHEVTDDLKAMFHADPGSLQKIKDMEDRIIPKFNHFASIPQKFYDENKHLDRKEFAIKGQKELGEFFHLAMNKYLVANNAQERLIDMKEWAVKNYKMFGVKDEDVSAETD